MAIAYSYLRFSTPAQAEGDSLRRQTALTEEYVRRHGLTLDTELRLQDLGVSGYRGDNVAVGALGAFLKAIRDGLVERGSYLLVESLDRVSRQQARKAVRVLEEIVEAGIIVVTLSDGKAYTETSLDGTDFLMAILLFMRANEESVIKAKRIAAAWSSKRADALRGKVLTRWTVGWVTVDDGKLQLIPERAEVVRRIFNMFIGGMGKESIASTLNDGLVPTFGRGRYWSKPYIAKVLCNPAVVGTLVTHTKSGRTRTPQQPIKGYYPAVIDEETFERAQALLKGRRTTTRQDRRVRNILSGLAECPKCAGAMTRVWKGSGEARLVCAAAKVGSCDYISVSQSLIESALVRAAGNPLPKAHNLDAELRSAESGLEAINEAIEELVSAIEQGHSAVLLERLKVREAARSRAEQALLELHVKANQADTKLLRLRTARYREAMLAQPLDVAKANAALREMVSRVVIDYNSSTLRLYWRHNGETDVAYDV